MVLLCILYAPFRSDINSIERRESGRIKCLICRYGCTVVRLYGRTEVDIIRSASPGN